MNKVNWSDEQFIRSLCADAKNYSDACRTLNLRPEANIRTLKKYIEKYQINVDHFDPFATRPQNQLGGRIPLKDILTVDSTYHRWHLKNRLIREGILDNKCDDCGQLPEWNGKVLKLHLDHKNGVGNDNRLINLRLLCPNCHSQTPTYGGLNKTN